MAAGEGRVSRRGATRKRPSPALRAASPGTERRKWRGPPLRGGQSLGHIWTRVPVSTCCWATENTENTENFRVGLSQRSTAWPLPGPRSNKRLLRVLRVLRVLRGQNSAPVAAAAPGFNTERTEDTEKNGELQDAPLPWRCRPGGTCPPDPLGVLGVLGGPSRSAPRYPRPNVTKRQPAPGEAKTRARVPQKEKVSDLKSDTFSRLWTLQRPSERGAGHSGSVARQGLHPGTRVQMGPGDSGAGEAKTVAGSQSQRATRPQSTRGRSSGNSSTSRMDGESVNSITRRSMPIPSPAVGGRPYSSAVT